jgi:hypothetical protein
MKPKTPADFELLERKLTEALDEVRARREELSRGQVPPEQPPNP